MLTPLIDMIFLVVIFFMLNTTLSINPAISVDLPAAYTSQAVVEREVVVTLSSDSELYIGATPVTLDRFAAELKKEMVRLGTEKMILQADETVAYRDLIEVMDRARLTGVESIALVTEPQSIPE